MEPFYRTSYSRALHSLAISGFYARELDADDFEFLEYVKTRGIANGSLPNTSAVLLEELEFWHLPYTIAPDVERRIGRRPPRVETDEERERRKARTNRWHAQRIIRENERAIAAAELAREQREWKAAQTKRKVRELITDAEWEAAAPKARFGKTVARRYVPNWKLDEQEITKWKADEASMAELSAKLAKWARLRKKLKRKRAWAREVREERGKFAKAQALKAKWLKTLTRARNRRLRKERETREAERQRRETILQEARQTVERFNALEQRWTGGANYTPAALQQAVMVLLSSTPGQVWTPDEMMRSLGGCTREFLDQCLDSLIRQGRLRKMEKQP